MKALSIYHKDGTAVRDTNGNAVTLRELEYTDSWMGECYVTADVKSPVPVLFAIGDYIEYRGERFALAYDPGKEKQARMNTYGEGFEYDSIKFSSMQDELARCEFLDVVLNDNDLHYTALPSFSFYAETVDDLLDRIQANLDEQAEGEPWKIFSANLYRSKQRGCTESEWEDMYADAEEEPDSFEPKTLTVDTKTCWEALALVNSEWDINFTVRNKNIYVGVSGKATEGIFRYGMGNGLYKIDQNADSEQSVITRLRAYGSDRNLPDHYYADLGISYKAGVVETHAGDAPTDIDIATDLDFMDTYFTLPRKYEEGDEKKTDGWSVTATFDRDTVITGYMKKGDTGKCHFRSGLKGDKDDNGLHESREDLLKFKSQAAGASTLYFMSGINKKFIPNENKVYAENLPNNMAISRLMLPGFPGQSLHDYYYYSMTDEERYYVNPSGKEHLFSQDPHRPYVDSVNADTIGVRPGSQFFDTDDKKNGLVDIYPTIEEMYVQGERIDAIYKGSEISDDGRLEDGETAKNFDIYLNPKIDFDINDLREDGFSVSMKDGMCGGRSFEVASATDSEGMWRLTLKRSKDDALGLWFPYKDYPISEGDHFVLTGITLPDSYVKAASLKLLKYAIALLDKNDYTRYVYQPKVDELFMARQHDAAMADKTGTTKSYHDTLKAGDLLKISDEDLGISKEIAIERLIIKEREDNIPEYEITLREDKEVGTIQKIQNQLTSLEMSSGSIMSSTLAKSRAQGSSLYLSKQTEDEAKGLITFVRGLIAKELSKLKAGLQIGETFVSGMLTGIGAQIDKTGNAEMQSLTLRSSLTVKELIYNRLTATEGSYVFSESGTIESVKAAAPTEEGGNTTYDITLKKRWENDFTAFRENDVLLASINDLTNSGKYYDCWLRVIDVKASANRITCVMYDDDETPGGENHVPGEMMMLIRWGNAVDESRQSLWYLSSTEQLFCMLNHVTKPIIDRTNYSMALGTLPKSLAFIFQDYPQADKGDSWGYMKGLAVEELLKVDYQGNVTATEQDRGIWSEDTAKGENPYRLTEGRYDTVWHYGCQYKCIKDKTAEEPGWASKGWAFRQGNPEFKAEMTSTEGWSFDADAIDRRKENGDYVPFTTLSVDSSIYNKDVSGLIGDDDYMWTRSTGDTLEDNAWAAKHSKDGRTVGITYDDLGADAAARKVCTFKCTVTLRDEKTAVETSAVSPQIVV